MSATQLTPVASTFTLLSIHSLINPPCQSGAQAFVEVLSISVCQVLGVVKVLAALGWLGKGSMVRKRSVGLLAKLN